MADKIIPSVGSGSSSGSMTIWGGNQTKQIGDASAAGAGIFGNPVNSPNLFSPGVQGAAAGMAGAKTTPVITSTPAIRDVNKIQGTLNTVTQGMQTNAQKQANPQQPAQPTIPGQTPPTTQSNGAAPTSFVGQEYVNGGLLQYGATGPDGRRYELFTPNVSDPSKKSASAPTPTTPQLINPTTPNKTTDPYNDQLNQIQQQTDQAYNDYRNSLSQLQNGTMPLTPDQQNQINSLQGQFDRLRQQQQIANKNYESGMGQIELASGRSRYAPSIAQGNIANAVNVGIQKVADLDTKAAGAVAEMRQGFQDKNFALVKEMYESYNNFMKEKSNTIMKMKDAVDKEAKDLLDYNFKAQQMDMEAKRFQMDLAKFDAERQDKQVERQTKLAGSVASQLVDLDENMNVQVADWNMIKEVAEAAGIDPNVLAGEMNKRADDLRKSSLDERKFKFDQYKYQSDSELDQAKFGLDKAKYALDKWDKEFNQQLKMEEIQAKGASYDLTGEQINDAIKKGYSTSEADLASYARQIKDGINPAVKKEKSPEERKLNANVLSGLDSLSTIQSKINAGVGLGKIADGDYRFAEKNLVDIIGRLRSGGAIGEEEAKNFEALMPSVFRSQDTNKRNIEELNKLLINTIGVDNYNDEKKKVYSDINSFNSLASQEEKKEFEKIVRDAGVKPGDDMNDYLDMYRQKKGFSGPLSTGVKGSFETRFPSGAPGGQCASFARKLVDIPPLGNGLNEKKAWVNKIGIPAAEWKSSPQVGDVIITDESKNYGHVAVVNKILPDGRIQLTESNYNNDEKVHHNRVMSLNSPRIYGAIRKPLKTNNLKSYAA